MGRVPPPRSEINLSLLLEIRLPELKKHVSNIISTMMPMIIIPSYKAGPIQIGGMTSHLRHKILRYYMQLNNKFAYTCDK